MHTSTSRRPRAFFIAGDRIVHIANPCGAGLSYQGHATSVAPGAQSEPVMHLSAETLIVIEDGTLEMMINGVTMSLSGGQYARVAPGQFFAWRNIDRRSAHILVKTAPPAQHHSACRVTFSIAAA
jgi:mannose-6-phosphate isomerase-like protein (cupin superfamily)